MGGIWKFGYWWYYYSGNSEYSRVEGFYLNETIFLKSRCCLLILSEGSCTFTSTGAFEKTVVLLCLFSSHFIVLPWRTVERVMQRMWSFHNSLLSKTISKYLHDLKGVSKPLKGVLTRCLVKIIAGDFIIF